MAQRKRLNTHKNVESHQKLPKNTRTMSIKRKRLSDALPSDASQSIVQSLEGHLGSALDET